MPLSVYQAQQSIQALLGSGSPATVYLALLIACPTSLGGGTEVAGGSYARAAITNDGTKWTGGTATSPSVVSNSADIDFPAATADWGVVGFFALYDAPSGGNLLWYGPLATAEDIASGDTFVVSAGNCNLALG